MASSCNRSAAWLRNFSLAVLLAAAADACAEAPIVPWKGDATPGLALSSIDGARVDLQALRGRVVVVNFWATWCEPCRDEMPSLERLRARMKDRPFEVLAVNYGQSAVAAKGFASKLQLTMPVLLDPSKKTAEEWKVRGLPMTFVVDPRGQLRYWAFGERDWSDGEMLRLVEDLLAEAPHARR